MIVCPLCKKETLYRDVSTNYALRELLQVTYKSEYETYKRTSEYRAIETLENYKTRKDITINGIGKNKEPERLLKLLILLEENYLSWNKEEKNVAITQNLNPFFTNNEVYIYQNPYVMYTAATNLSYYLCISKNPHFSLDVLMPSNQNV